MSRKQSKARGRSGKSGMVRIIGGSWRGRRLPVADVPGLRPSGDRSRETLFNWLQAELPGARVADLFAGTGVLGFEAVSRGAAGAVLIEQDRDAVRVLSGSVAALDAQSRVEVSEGDALAWLKNRAAGSLDIVFADPPFGAGLARPVLEALRTCPALRTGGLVYLETARDAGLQGLPRGWEVVREKVLGEVRMQLLQKI
ncbi:16S rRNA (guanine(966)-N(2))-methyltransferase RsmD [Elongatibacter sediminis]|uniref:Ribosomal RNA small subunit methyltransferase D n=1 Tax=Elongatibacter sediminis TaxID=3119006 RepID=A0AAW9RFQ3_9GAMM